MSDAHDNENRPQRAAIKFTNLSWKNIRLKDGEGPHEVRDAGQPHHYLYLGETGNTPRTRYRFNGKPQPPIVHPRGIGLAESRSLTAGYMFLVAKGIDPRAERKAAQQATVLADKGTVAAVFKNYMAIEGKGLRSARARERIFERFVYPTIGTLQITDVTPATVKPILDGIESSAKGDAGGKRMRDMVLMNIKRVLNWHGEDSDFKSPIAKMKPRLKRRERIRKVKLEDNEIAAVWKATLAVDEEGNPKFPIYGAVVRLLLLAGCRRSEVAGIRRSEIGVLCEDGKEYTVWRLPANPIGKNRNKVGKSKGEVVRPLSRAALEIINSMPAIGDGDLVFTLNGRNAYAMNNKGQKDRLEELSGVSGKRLHDLRRTFRTLCSRRKVPRDVAERCLGHAVPVLDDTYDQHSYYEQMQECVDAVANEIERVVTGQKKATLHRLRG